MDLRLSEPVPSDEGDPTRAVEGWASALAIATGLGDFALEAMANFFLGTAYSTPWAITAERSTFRRNAASLTGDLIRALRHDRPSRRDGAHLAGLRLADLGAFDEAPCGEKKRCGWPRQAIIPSASSKPICPRQSVPPQRRRS